MHPININLLIMINQNTIIEKYNIKCIDFFVKREDLACTFPGPPFAKVRGLYKFLQKAKIDGFDTIGYMDTAISMAGWGLAYFCKNLGLNSVIFYPKYKDGFHYNQSIFIKKWEDFGSKIIPLNNPGQLQINAIRAKKIFETDFKKGLFLKPGLKFNETITEVAKEAEKATYEIMPKTIICSVGSGIMITGVIVGVFNSKIKINKLIGVTVHKKSNENTLKNNILKLGGFGNGLFDKNIFNVFKSFEIINGGFLYEEVPKTKKQFPCNDYYELKAYKYMIDHIENFEKPILFWNIGA